ncbi:MAG: hypothetical protein WDM85_12110 [Caulobacteraceae bacterium]
MFRELGVSYLGRDDLASVDPQALNADGLGGGKADEAEPQAIARLLSKGFSRGAAPTTWSSCPSARPPTPPAARTSALPAATSRWSARASPLICQTCGGARAAGRLAAWMASAGPGFASGLHNQFHRERPVPK